MAGQKKRKGLGSLGVDVLLSTPVQEVPSVTGNGTDKSAGLDYIPIDLVDRSPFQPRQQISEQGIQELADSISSQGLIQPIVVRQLLDRYELICR